MLFDWIENNKDKDTVLINFLKFFYSIGRIEVLHSIIVTTLSIIIPFAWDGEKYWLTVVLGIALVSDIIFNYVCSRFEKRKYIQRRFAAEVLENQSSLVNSIIIEMQSNPHWRNTIFKKTSEIVCEKIQKVFKEILKCNTRISIEYIFEKQRNGKGEKHLKMAGRRSPNRDTCKKAVLFENRNKYFSYKIFKDNKQGINILPEKKIKDAAYWYVNSSHSTKVKQYLGIAISVAGEQVDFVLQIDCLDDITFGKTNSDEEIKEFINRYLKPYINIVSLSYLLNLNKNKQIPEV